MGHISNTLPNNTYLISADVDIKAPPRQGKFNAVTCTVAGTLKVTGGGVYEYVDVSDATDTFQNYIDPDTGAPFVDDATMNTAGDGFYERKAGVSTDVVMIAGQTIYGRFDNVTSDGTFTGFAYT